MRRLASRLALLGLAVASLGAVAESQVRPWEGASTLPLAGPALDGRAVDLKAFRGRVVLVNFWATWCEPCREEMPAIVRLQEKLRGQPFAVLAVNYGESKERVAEFLKRERVSLPVVLDPDKQAAEAWNAKGLPMTFLVGADGRVRYWVFGEKDWSEGDALALVEKLVAEAPRAGH